MIIAVDRQSEEPVYTQIARQIRAHIAAGHLPAGRMLPAVRTLATDLGVNLNTVARAYRRLEQEGFLQIHHRAGAEVRGPQRRIAPKQSRRFRDELRQLLQRMHQSGFALADLRRTVTREIDALDGQGSQS